MEKVLSSFTSKNFIERYNEELLNFDFAIQRDGNQWTAEQMSMLIRSVIGGRIIPSIYLIKEPSDRGEIWTVIDGKQRLTILLSYRNGEFKLSKNTPSITVNGKEYDIAGKKYEDLPTNIKDRFNLYTFDIVFIVNYSDEELEEQFYCLNNGSIFTKQQKAVVKLGGKLAEKLRIIEQHPFWSRTAITGIQKRHGIVMEVILKSLMLLTDYKYNQFGAAEVIKFSDYYSENYNDKEIEYLEELINTLHKSMTDDDDLNKLLKPINIPTFIMNLEYFEGLDQPSERYVEFIEWWCKTGSEESEYSQYCGSGSTNRNKVWGRMEAMNKCLDDFLEKNKSEEFTSEKQTA